MYAMKKFPIEVIKALDSLKGGRDFDIFYEWFAEARKELEYRIAYATGDEAAHIQGVLAFMHHVMNTADLSRETLESFKRKNRR